MFQCLNEHRKTECDRTGNTHSTRRRLDRILYLLVKNGNDWMMPQGNLIEGNSLCQVIGVQHMIIGEGFCRQRVFIGCIINI